ncbi:alcohol dehydrogenase II [Carex littledalei]|uniref:alcohol dehydrogenase n=1 Tax=Carex littledalei TaxID=544730 RepID=A0A833R1B3_9POAL|nr:alcohol dehydrogenase II [Carex littledalei]
MCELLRINPDRKVMIGDGQACFSIDDQPIYHFLGTSTFRKYTVVHSGFDATVNVAKPKKGSTVAIFGLRAVGLSLNSLAAPSLSIHLNTQNLCKRLATRTIMFILKYNEN